MIDVFTTYYHCAVDDCLIQDLLSTGANVYMPDDTFGKKIWYLYRWNRDYPVKLISYDQFINHPKKFAVLCPCPHHWVDFWKLIDDRGGRDEMVLITAKNLMYSYAKEREPNYILTHDVDYHRECKAKYKMIYFTKPALYCDEIKNIDKCYTEMNISKYQNHFNLDFFNGVKREEIELAMEFRKIWKRKTGNEIKFYGCESEHGVKNQGWIHRNMINSMFTLSVKKVETWGQMVNESMLLGTPVIVIEEYLSGTFKHYEITDDTAIIKKKNESVEQCINRILSMTIEQYETLCMQAQTIAEIFTSKEPRQKQLKWLLSKIPE